MDGDHDDTQLSTSRSDSVRAFYIRFFRFFFTFVSFLLMVFFFLFEEEGDNNILTFMFMGLFAIGLASTICAVMTSRQQQNAIHNILTQQELHDMERDDDYDDNDDGAGSEEWMATCSFEGSPAYIKSCRAEISYDRPQNGRYKVVYNAVYFGKSIRSESQMLLQFEAVAKGKGNGWEITGSNISGSTRDFQNSRPISKGFINARGEMYWRLVNPQPEEEDGGSTATKNLEGTYRGWFDIRSNSMFDGEFQAGNAPTGRIVRMELIGAGETPPSSVNHKKDHESNGGSDDVVEMVELGNSFV